MMLTCPNNTDHKLFNVSAWSAEIWTVDEKGEVLNVVPDDVVERGDTYMCDVCDIEAKVAK
jgi:hypothetical protein